MRDLWPRWAKRFDAEPLFATSAGGLTIVLISSSTMWRCEISGPRIDLYWVRPEPQAPALQVADFYGAAGPFLSEYSGFFELRVGRLAAIVTRLARHDSPATALAQHFCRSDRQDVLEDSQSFELHTHQRLALGTRLLCNTRVRAAAGLAADVGPTLIKLEQDVNTLADEAAARNFKPAEMAEFYTAAGAALEAGLTASFPPAG